VHPVLLGFVPSSRRHRERLHTRRFPPLRFVPSSSFHGSSTAFSALRLRGLLSSRNHVQGFTPFRGFSRPAALTTHRRSVPPCRFRPRAHLRIAPSAATFVRRDFEALIHGPERSSATGVSRRRYRSPLRFLPPSGLLVPTTAPRSSVPPLLTLRLASFPTPVRVPRPVSPRCCVFSVSVGRFDDVPVSGSPACSRFFACRPSALRLW